ncbi:MAG: hypothetical protein GC181_11640 [Bacteroidetes bacterium]|nr:hypothetical protein [Bacteroidota bacterium]
MKKIAFVAIVLFASLILLQYGLMQNLFNQTASKPETSHEQNVQPVHDQIFDTGDYIVVLKSGKYYVYKKTLPST